MRAARVAPVFRGCDARTGEQRRPEVHGHVRPPPSRFSDSGSAAWRCCLEQSPRPAERTQYIATKMGVTGVVARRWGERPWRKRGNDRGPHTGGEDVAPRCSRRRFPCVFCRARGTTNLESIVTSTGTRTGCVCEVINGSYAILLLEASGRFCSRSSMELFWKRFLGMGGILAANREPPPPSPPPGASTPEPPALRLRASRSSLPRVRALSNLIHKRVHFYITLLFRMQLSYFTIILNL